MKSNTYISLLRGINISGKKLIKMSDLKSILSEIGLENVITYIQSGNIIFQYENVENSIVSEKISKIIFDKYGFDVPVITLNRDELLKITSENPFLNEDIEKVHITFLSEIPSNDNIKKINSINVEPDKFIIVDKAIYIFYTDKYGKTKLVTNFFENKLKVKATDRNIKTINKLIELSSTI